jgi:DNA-binding beta-propeller fold protein YncE
MSQTVLSTRAARLTLRIFLTALAAGAVLSCMSASAFAASDAVGIAETSVVHGKTDGAANTAYAVAVDPAANIVAVTGSSLAGDGGTQAGSGRVWLINGRTHKVTATIKLVGGANAGVAFDPSAGVFAVADDQLATSASTTNSNAVGAVVEINPHTGHITKVISVAGAGPGITVDPQHRVMYVTGPGYSVTVMNARTGAVKTTVPNIYYPFAISVDPVTRTVYVGGGQGTIGVWEFDGANNTPIGFNGTTKAVTLATPSSPQGVATDPATGHTYVVYGGATVKVRVLGPGLHGKKLTVKGTLDAEPLGVAVDPVRNDVYVSGESGTAGCPDVVAEIDARTDEVVGYVYGVADATALAVDPRTDTVWAANGTQVAAFKGGLDQKQPKCGTAGITIGA